MITHDFPNIFWEISDNLQRSGEAIFRTLIMDSNAPFYIILALRPRALFGPKFGQFLFAIIYQKRVISGDRWIAHAMRPLKFWEVSDNLPLSEEAIFRTLITDRYAPFQASF